MKKFALVFTVATAAMLATACGPQPQGDGDWTDSDTRVCRDRQGRRVDDRQCRTNNGSNGMFFWYFISRGGYVPNVGHKYDDNYNRRYGSTRPSAGARYVPSARSPSVSRGGFGRSGGFGSSGG